jgi:DNA (cytosine-5)-methyltransferase 1
LDVYKDNFPDTKLYHGDLSEISPARVKQEIGEIDLILASPECTSHSPARGRRPACEKSRETAFQVVRFAKVFKPRWIVVENVVSMRKWSRYPDFIREMRALEYWEKEQVLIASNFGVPQSRRRLFILFDREQAPNDIVLPAADKRTAAEIISSNGTYPFSPLRTEKRAKPTLDRAERAIAELGNDEPFLIVYYGSDQAGGWQPLDVPLRTITTLDRFAYVKPSPDGHLMRMLQVPELKASMGMPETFCISQGSRRDRIKILGNAVCPPLMKSAIRCLTQDDQNRGS